MLSKLLGLIGKRKKSDIRKISYSQSGEDLIVEFLFSWLGIERFSYLDLGTNDPQKLNNTYLFYTKGHSGLLVEADSTLGNFIRKIRPKDELIISAVSDIHDAEITFYKMNSDTLSSVSQETVNSYEKNSNHKIDLAFKVSNIHINELLKKYFSNNTPEFISYLRL